MTAEEQSKSEKGQMGSPWLRELYEYFAPVREEAIEKGYREEEINADIDEAFREVRARQAAELHATHEGDAP